jgi:hydrogenase maturation protein HypF
LYYIIFKLFIKELEEIALDVVVDIEPASICGRLHQTVVVQGIIAALEQLFRSMPKAKQTIVLSGGSIHNRYLRKRLNAELRDREFEVYFSEKVPCNDGGQSYGQLVVAAAKRSANECVLEYQLK